MRISGRGVDFVPPTQADEAAAGDVFEVVEIEGEEEEGEYEDKDAGRLGGQLEEEMRWGRRGRKEEGGGLTSF